MVCVFPISIPDWSVPISIFPDEETDMDVHDRGMLYYRLLKHDVTEVSVVLWVTMVMDSPLVTALF